MKDLIQKLELATEADRALDLRIHIALFDPKTMVDGGGYRGERAVKYAHASTIWNDAWPHWDSPSDVAGIARHLSAPNYTGSIDAAIILIRGRLRMLSHELQPNMSGKQWTASIHDGGTYRATARTPALAICIAALKSPQ